MPLFIAGVVAKHGQGRNRFSSPICVDDEEITLSGPHRSARERRIDELRALRGQTLGDGEAVTE